MKYILTMAMVFFLSACGGSDNSKKTTVEVKQAPTVISMLPNKAYLVSKGDKLEKTRAGTIVEITKNEDKTEVTLLQGEAKITLAK